MAASGSKPDGCLVAAVDAGEADTVAAFLKSHPEAPTTGLLHAAAAAGHAQVVRRLLDAGADPAELDEDGQTALHHATCEGHVEAVQLLAPDSQCAQLFVNDKYEMTPFHLACEGGHNECVAHILALCEAVTPSSRGQAEQMRRGSALFLAQQGGHDTVVGLIHGTRRLSSVLNAAADERPASDSSSAAPSAAAAPAAAPAAVTESAAAGNLDQIAQALGQLDTGSGNCGGAGSGGKE